MKDSVFLALLFTCLKLTVLLAAQTQLIGSHQPIVALVGDDVLLPCHLEPAVSATHETVVWSKAGLEPKYVHYHQDGRLLFEKENPSYSLRTRLFMDELPRGNVSMKIFKVKLSDAGTYKCSLPAMKKEAEVELIVGQSDVIGSDQPVKVLVSDDIILPCHLEPPLDVTTLSVEWRRGPVLVHVYRNRGDDPVSQDQNFKGRTSLFPDEMTRGNISLKLTDVTEQDAGNYTCSVPKLQRSSVTLVVGFHSTFIVIIAVIAVIVLVGFIGAFLKNRKIEKQFLSVKSKLHGEEKKILQQQNINIRCIHSSPDILDISLSAGLWHHDQSAAASTNSSPTSGNFLQNKDPNGARLKHQHFTPCTLEVESSVVE
ncbi:butyrophilin subfamily 1 member A1-like [Acanthopagrus schlegelii]